MREWMGDPDTEANVIDTCSECGCDICEGDFRFKYRMQYTNLILCADCHDNCVEEFAEGDYE